MDAPRSSRAELWILAACLAGGLALRLAWIGDADLWADEVHTLRTMELPLGDVVPERLRAGHVPLYFLLLKDWTALFGTSQAALRAPSALLGTALLVPAFLLLRRVAGSTAARAGAALLAVHPLFVELSREARMYPLLALSFLVLAESALATLGDGRVRGRFWAAAAIGPFVHASWAFAVLPFGVWLAIERRRVGPEVRLATPRLLAGVTASLVVLVALLLWAEPQHQVLTRRPWPAEALVFALRPYLGSKPSTWFPTGALAALAWAVALYAGVRLAPSRALRLGVALVVGVPAASSISGLVAGVPWGPARYVQAATIGGVLLACGVLASGETDATPLRRLVRALGIGALVLVGVTTFLLSLFAIRTGETVWSDAAAEIRRTVPPGGTVTVADESARLVLSHYLGDGLHPLTVGAPDAAEWSVRLVRTGDGARAEMHRAAR